MVGSNKILTVSYGTFSCTLEGFDDSFDSMKAIAEYFRDLAQEDRYFGAEPPTPDAEMLAKIAEREISRRVEAQMDDRGIHLRATAPAAVAALSGAVEAAPAEAGADPEPAGSSDTDESATATAEVAMPPVADEPDVTPLEVSDFMTAPTAEETAAPTAPTALAGNATGIAAKLARIRAVVSEPAAPTADTADAEEFEATPEAGFPDIADDDSFEEISDETDVLAFDEDDSVAEVAEADDEAVDEALATDEETAAEEAVPEDTSEEVTSEDDAVSEDAGEEDTTAEDTVAEDTVADEIVEDDAASEDEDTAADESVEETLEDASSDAETEDLIEAADAAETSEEAAEDAPSEDTAEAETATEDDAVADAVAAALADETEAEAAIEPLETAEEDEADTAEETDTETLKLASEDLAWASAALATSQSGAEADDILTDDAENTAEDAEASAEAEVDAADETPDAAELYDDAETSDLSSDLNDIDPVVPTIAPAASPARIVRIRKDGPAEVYNIKTEDGDAAEENVSVALKTEAVETSDNVDEDATEVAIEDIVEETAEAEADAESRDDTSPFQLNADVEAAVSDALDDTAQTEADDEVAANADAAPGNADHNDIRAAIAAAMPTGSLSDEDEDDLQRELAAVAEEVVVLDDDTTDAPEEIVVADTAEDDTIVAEDDTIVAEDDTSDKASDDETTTEEPAAADTSKESTPEVVHSRPRSRRRLPDADHAVTRMIAQTDEALNEPAGSRRRNAIAQLKAAVAATEAARQLGDNENEKGEAENAFRNDLNEVVRPSKPIEVDTQAERPRAAPLKLVASQRVDGEPAEATAETPRPQSTPKTEDDYGGFAQFAASMGATELPDLLEAAAAYTSFVEGVEDFSRPQIMKKVQMTTSEEFSREDGLRSFGTLLRQGRISKVRNGRFQVSEQTRFRPDARSA